MIKITAIVWDNPLSFDAYLPTSQFLAFHIHEDEVEDFLYDTYGYIPRSFQFDRESN